MAIYRLEVKIISRRAKNKAGNPIPVRKVSVVAKAAYRAGDKLYDEQQDKTYNYRSRAQQVLHSELVIPDDAPVWLMPSDQVSDCDRREQLWNTIERTEKRVDSQLAREFVIALPVELQDEQNVGLVRAWCQQEFAAQGYVSDFALHASDNGNNPHAHILCTLRPVEGDGFVKKPDMAGKFNGQGNVGTGAKSDLQGWRESWEISCNDALAGAGLDVRVDHRSLKDQGIDREPEPKIGVAATGMQKRGAEEDPDRVRDARQVRLENELRPAINAAVAGDETSTESADMGWAAWLRSSWAFVRAETLALWRDESSGRPMAEPDSPSLMDATATTGSPEPNPFGRNADFEPEK